MDAAECAAAEEVLEEAAWAVVEPEEAVPEAVVAA